MAKIKITQKRNNSTEISISGELNIYCAMELYQEHFKALKFKEVVIIKLAGISEIDTAGAQLLILLFKEIASKKASYTITTSSNAIDEYSQLFNLARYFTPDAQSLNEVN
jgi:anti-anti-sigma factor